MAELKVLSIFESASPADTERLASVFAEVMCGGEIILLEGPIGAGKTYFTRGLARAMGIKKLPSSASFGMMRVYRGKKLRLYHFDLFRAGEEDMENIGVEEFFGSRDGVSVMEWSGAAGNLAGDTGYLKLEFELAGGDSRRIKASCLGAESERFLKKAEIKWKQQSA